MPTNATIFERIILTNPHAQLDRYEGLARRAADAGVTHMTVSAVPQRSRWEIDDPADPYLQWAFIHASLYKVVPPDLLSDWVPAEYAQKFLDLIKRRCDVLDKHKLKAAFLGYEPAWWPESAFRKAPQLRGPRIDHPRRSRHPRFAPDISNPQVLDIYRQMIQRLIHEAPIKLLVFSTNDSGTGVSWSEHLYNHANGPAYAPFIPFGQRLKTFLETCDNGAADGGSSDTEIYIRTLMSPIEQDSAASYLTRSDGSTRIAFFTLNPLKVDSIQGLTSTYLYPLADVGQPFALLRRLSDAAERGRHGVIVNPMAEVFVTEWQGDGPDLEVLRAFLANPARDVLAMTQTLASVMTEKYGQTWGPRMLQMYWHLDRSISAALESVNSGGLLLEIWLLAERWLTRPLVPLPELLTADEKSYYRPHQFQAMSETEADNPLEAQGGQMISGVHVGRGLMPQIFRTFEGEIQRAIAALAGEDLPPEIRKIRSRLQALVCLIRCCDNFIQFTTLAQHVRDNAPRDPAGNIVPPDEPNWGNHGDRENRSLLYNLMRAEIDNTQNLIGLLESSPDELLVVADREEDEDIFNLSPKLTDQLRRKIQIMLDHWLDLDLLLKRPNL